MKTSIWFRWLGASALGLTSVSWSAAAGDAPKVEKRITVIHGDDSGTPRPAMGAGDQHNLMFVHTAEASEDTGPVTFLGVETSPVSPTLTEQLGLPKGMGLVVQRVLAETAAEKVLKRYDILTRFEDQLLISAEQLGVLVRSKAAGTAVKLMLVRGGKEQVVTVELGERKAPLARRIEFRSRNLGEAMPGPDQLGRLHEGLRGLHGDISRADVDHLIGSLDARRTPGMRWVEADVESGGGPVVRMMEGAQGNVVYSDDDGVVELKTNEAGKLLVVKSADGTVVFEGPVNSDEQRAALADGVKQRLEKVENIRHVELRTGEGFETDRLRVLQPGVPTAVTMPRPAAESVDLELASAAL